VKNSPLHSEHLALGAKMADFGGWLMPIEYPGAGVLAEHAAVRERVGLFDVSHLGKASVKGAGALEFLNTQFTNDLNRIKDSQAQYTLCCNDDGGVIDDLIVYRNSADDFFLIPNASNTAEVVRVLKANAPEGIVIENIHENFGVIALQGPRSSDVLASLGVDADIEYMSFKEIEIGGAKALLCRTGYTGEYGFEIVPTSDSTQAVWKALVLAMEPFRGVICGLGARDTLRTEMGYPLHGHELSLSITPVQASAQWAIGWKKESFTGSSALQKERERGAVRVLRGLASKDRGIPRAGMAVKNEAGEVIGEITSGTFSPTRKHGIALALVAPNLAIGDSVIIDIRGRDCLAKVVALPMVESHVR
jgi:aminomethyltransferase